MDISREVAAKSKEAKKDNKVNDALKRDATTMPDYYKSWEKFNPDEE